MAKKKRPLNISAKKRRKLVEKVRRSIGKSYTDNQIMAHCKIRIDLLHHLKAEILNMDTAGFEHLSSGGVYSDYLMKSTQMIKKLHDLQKKYYGRQQNAAAVAAIKQEKDILDSCIKLGQDFGFIEKKSQSLEVTSEFTFGHMTEAEMKDEIKDEMKRLNDLANNKVIEMRPELLDVTDADVASFIPANIAALPKEAHVKRKVKIKTKVRLRK